MAILTYPTQTTVRGPLLIDSDQLTTLDNIFDEQMEKLRAVWKEDPAIMVQVRIGDDINRVTDVKTKARIIKDTQETVASVYGGESRSAVIYLPKGRTVSSDRFSDAIAQAHVADQVANGFRYDLQVGITKASVSLSPDSESLNVQVSAEQQTIGLALFGLLENWISDIRPPRWQRLWAQLTLVFVVLLFVWCLMGAILLFRPVNAPASVRYQSESQQLLKQGVNQSNQNKATELVLAIVSDYNPNNQVLKRGLKWWGYYLAGILVFTTLCIRPGVVIGIWGGKRRLALWRGWMKLIWVTIPGLVLTTVLWPQILRLFSIT